MYATEVNVTPSSILGCVLTTFSSWAASGADYLARWEELGWVRIVCFSPTQANEDEPHTGGNVSGWYTESEMEQCYGGREEGGMVV